MVLQTSVACMRGLVAGRRGVRGPAEGRGGTHRQGILDTALLLSRLWLTGTCLQYAKEREDAAKAAEKAKKEADEAVAAKEAADRVTL